MSCVSSTMKHEKIKTSQKLRGFTTCHSEEMFPYHVGNLIINTSYNLETSLIIGFPLTIVSLYMETTWLYNNNLGMLMLQAKSVLSVSWHHESYMYIHILYDVWLNLINECKWIYIHDSQWIIWRNIEMWRTCWMPFNFRSIDCGVGFWLVGR